MFRDGRRKKQFMSQEATEEILNRGLAGVLGVNGDNGYPYTVPISYVYDRGKIYLHSTGSMLPGSSSEPGSIVERPRGR